MEKGRLGEDVKFMTLIPAFNRYGVMLFASSEGYGRYEHRWFASPLADLYPLGYEVGGLWSGIVTPSLPRSLFFVRKRFFSSLHSDLNDNSN